MNTHEEVVRNCKIGIKAFQNINAASMGFSKMHELAETNDPILIPSVFYWAVIRYAKPFLNSKLDARKMIYPIKHLKSIEGYSSQMHEHLIVVRNTLVAHDDFTEISPRILIGGIHIPDEDYLIPTSIVVSNKSISFPKDRNTVKKMLLHSQAVCNGTHSKLIRDIEKLRSLALTNPEFAMEGAKYMKDYGAAKIEAEGSLMGPPNFMSDEWLDASVPDYSELHDGYMYEEARINKEFPGPEKITTPNGLVFEFTPTKFD